MGGQSCRVVCTAKVGEEVPASRGPGLPNGEGLFAAVAIPGVQVLVAGTCMPISRFCNDARTWTRVEVYSGTQIEACIPSLNARLEEQLSHVFFVSCAIGGEAETGRGVLAGWVCSMA